MEELKKLWETVKAHPLLFTSIAAVIVIYIFWPSGTQATNTSNGLSAEEAAIAAASQANAQLTLAEDQVQIAGMGYQAAVTTNAATNARDVSIASLEAGVATLNSNNQLTAFENQNATHLSGMKDLEQATIQSQNSAQDFVTTLEKAGLQSPQIQTAGANIAGTMPPPPPVTLSYNQPTFINPYLTPMINAWNIGNGGGGDQGPTGNTSSTAGGAVGPAGGTSW